MSDDFLDKKLCEDFRNVINSSPVFSQDDKYLPLFNLICAAMDRIDSSINYLNLHCHYPNTEEDFICFMVFAVMLIDGVKNLVENVAKQEMVYDDDKAYFKRYCIDEPLCCTEEECPTDDKFFEHFRSLTFAHPYETSHNPVFRRKFGNQVSPWVFVNRSNLFAQKFPEPIGVKIYTQKKDGRDSDTHFVMISFPVLKEYIASRYNKIIIATNWAINIINSSSDGWKKNKVNRNQKPLDVLKEIKSINEQRYVETFTIQDIIDYMECPLSDMENEDAVNQFRKYIIDMLDELCDAVDALDYDLQTEIELDMIHFNLKNMHKQFSYQIEKIFSYLSGEKDEVEPGSNEEWGLLQAKYFYEEFAHKWVHIKTDEMSYKEIRLLVTTACYLEMKEQTS